MADTAASNNNTRGGFKGGFGGKRGGNRGGKPEDVWTPVTKLGRMVKEGLISSLEEVFLYSLPIKEYQIVDHFLPNLADAVLKIMSVQKQTTAGQRTRFKAFVAVGDSNGHFGLGVKCAKEVATAIRGAICNAKMAIIPVRRGYWGNKIGLPHTVPCKVHGKCGSVSVRLIPAPKGSGIVSSLLGKKLLHMAGVDDCFTCTSGTSKTQGNYAKALYAALIRTYTYLTPDLWSENDLNAAQQQPYAIHSDFLSSKPIVVSGGKFNKTKRN